MKKSLFTLLLALAALGAATAFLACRDVKPKKTFVVGIINPNPGTMAITHGFVAGLQERCAAQGEEVRFIRHERRQGLDAAIESMKGEPVDLLFSVTTPVTRKVKEALAGSTIEGIYAMHDPVESGIIDSLSRPGGNMTGVQIRGSVPKALDWLMTLAPGIKNLFVPIRFDTKAAAQSLAELRLAADLFAIRLTVAEVNTEAELDAALKAMPPETDAIFLLNSILTSAHARTIAAAAIAHGIPSGGPIGKVEEGLLITFSPELDKIGRQASRIAFLVLHGEKAGDLPTERADFFLRINLKTAQQSGIEVPQNILQQADSIIR